MRVQGVGWCVSSDVDGADDSGTKASSLVERFGPVIVEPSSPVYVVMLGST